MAKVKAEEQDKQPAIQAEPAPADEAAAAVKISNA